MGLDLIDKRIVVELLYNSRLSYRVLARYFGLTIKSIRKRIAKLIEQGVIGRFYLTLNRTACGSDAEAKLTLGQIWTDGSEQDDTLIELLGDHYMIYRAFKTTRNTFGAYAMALGFQGLSDLTEFLQGIDCVTKVETDSLIFVQSPGLFPELVKWHLPKIDALSKDQWQIVLCLKDNPRMPIAEVARQTGQSVRRVRKSINLLVETRYIIPTISWVPAAAGHVEAFLRTDLDLNQISREEFANWLYEKYPLECWDAQFVADSPSTVIQYVSAPTIHILDEIQNTVKEMPSSKNVDLLVTYRQYRFAGLREHLLDQMLKNAEL